MWLNFTAPLLGVLSLIEKDSQETVIGKVF